MKNKRLNRKFFSKVGTKYPATAQLQKEGVLFRLYHEGSSFPIHAELFENYDLDLCLDAGWLSYKTKHGIK